MQRSVTLMDKARQAYLTVAANGFEMHTLGPACWCLEQRVTAVRLRLSVHAALLLVRNSRHEPDATFAKVFLVQIVVLALQWIDRGENSDDLVSEQLCNKFIFEMPMFKDINTFLFQSLAQSNSEM